ncbi:hypothetical protein GCM10011519_33180 [Marmoricola endophyticus]|uniref:EfeO-type cupredoxin-like domain-containing protein n=1 Tax=Marmoricola endophyticus TaxID=2040280 RepID=A0A917BUR6_9ACTN|nr:hypothetical protein [Marmoricola endophyticus]GGF56648.1 hypothetical protein GCM10011519_33180 [Marmoricola endophyticus]
MPATLPRRPYAAALAAAALLLLAGCGSESSGSSGSTAAPSSSASSLASAPSSSPSSSSSSQTVAVRIEGEKVTPRNKRIQVEAGQPLTVRVVSDRDGELHVHSSPETTFDFGPGTSTKTFTIARPGIVEMEEHVSDTLVAQLEAR